MNSELKELYNLSDNGDRWGQCMMFWFAISGTLYRHGGEIPEEWNFRPGLGDREGRVPEEWPDAEIEEMYKNGGISLDELTYAGNVFSRYSDCLKLKGIDY